MSELESTRTIEVVGAEIRALTATALNNIIEIGRRMCEAKALLPHGEFYPWIEETAGYKKSTANNFMRLFRAYAEPQGSLFGAEVSNLQTFGGLSYSKALALLEVPAEEREEFARENDLETMTTRQLREAIRERDEARAELRETADKYAAMSTVAREAEQTVKEYSEQNVYLTDELANAEKRVRELESRPVEVAVQVDEEAVKRAADDAQAAADARWSKELEQLKKKLSGVEKKRDELEQAVKRAEEKAAAASGSAEAETDRLRAEVERLSRQLKLSGEAVTACRLHFNAWQRSYTELKAALAGMEQEDAKRIGSAMIAQLRAWLKEAEE